ncbi:hypothetical protein SK128_026591, partial [Halocaridina rubra]
MSVKPRAHRSATVTHVRGFSTHNHSTLLWGSATALRSRSPQRLVCAALHLNNGNLWKSTHRGSDASPQSRS